MTRRFKPGDRDIPSAFLNRVGESADIVLGGRGGLPVAANGINPSVIMVRNNSGSDVPRYGVIGLGDVQISESDNSAEFYKRVYMSGEVPRAHLHNGFFAVALEPIADGAVGKCAISGVVQCQLTVNADWHEYADVSDNDVDKLTSGPVGYAKILWVAGASGDQWAVVLLNAPPPEQTYARLTSKVAAAQQYEASEVVLRPGTALTLVGTGRSFNSSDMGNLYLSGCGSTASTFNNVHPMPDTLNQLLPVFWARDGGANTWKAHARSLYAPGQTFAVRMVVLGGSGGNASTQASYIYRLNDLEGNQIATSINPSSGSRSDYMRPLRGEMEAATRGLAYFDEVAGQVRLASCNESPIVGSLDVVTGVDFTEQSATSTTIAAPVQD